MMACTRVLVPGHSVLTSRLLCTVYGVRASTLVSQASRPVLRHYESDVSSVVCESRVWASDLKLPRTHLYGLRGLPRSSGPPPKHKHRLAVACQATRLGEGVCSAPPQVGRPPAAGGVSPGAEVVQQPAQRSPAGRKRMRRRSRRSRYFPRPPGLMRMARRRRNSGTERFSRLATSRAPS
jgi:hypothetical protein